MSVPERVVAFLRGGKPGAYCDDCIRDGLHLARRQEVAIVTLTLAQCAEFRREMGTCASRKHDGNREKLVTSAI
jgi:hypothetical protein